MESRADTCLARATELLLYSSGPCARLRLVSPCFMTERLRVLAGGESRRPPGRRRPAESYGDAEAQ